ncbi:phosphoglycerate mutase [Actinomycetota bacterium]|nr:phosphoglycerate mutase [Actinomycetota bacterium]
MDGAADGVRELLLVRHGESVGNVAATAAERSGAQEIDVETRDADTPLSPTGREQAEALGDWLGGLPPGRVPQSLWCSPYLRTRDTARLALASGGLTLPTVVDERLRDRELGVLDRLTVAGIEARYPAEAVRRARLGKLYYRPPGGESWSDVALRVRSLLADLDRREPGRRVLLVSHDAVVMLVRYVCEQLDEEALMQLVRTSSVRNASVTRLARTTDGGWRLEDFDEVGHLERRDAAVTEHAGRNDDAHA